MHEFGIMYGTPLGVPLFFRVKRVKVYLGGKVTLIVYLKVTNHKLY